MPLKSLKGLNEKGVKGMTIGALVSIGRHPQSGRTRRAEQDARAVELGLQLVGHHLSVIHAGDPNEPVLRQYAGMGLDSINVIKQSNQADAVATLGQCVKKMQLSVVLTGVRAENGESSGMLPYLLAESLGWPLVSHVADIVAINEAEAEVLLALPRGQRRSVKVAVPFVASIDNAAPEPRQSAFGPGLRAKLEVEELAETLDDERLIWQEAIAKPRVKRLKTVKAKNAADRFKAAVVKQTSSKGQLLKEESAADKAKAIFDLLIEENVIR